MNLSVAITKNNGFELDWEKELQSIEDFFKRYNIPIEMYVEFFESKLLMIMDKEKTDKFDPIFLDVAVHRKHLNKFNYSCFTVSREEYDDLPGSRWSLRGWQSYPNMPIGEMVVIGEAGRFVYQKSGRIKSTSNERTAKKGDWYLSQWAYTFTHELFHAITDQLKLKDKLHDYVDEGKFALYPTEYLKLQPEEELDGPEEEVQPKPLYDVNPIVRHLRHHFNTNNPTSIVLHTLLGSLEGSYSWLDHIGLSYNYLIDTDGTIYEQVHWSNGAWHAGKVFDMSDKAKAFYGTTNPNLKSIGIAYARNGEQELTKEQAGETVKLLKWLGQQTGSFFDSSNIFAHREITKYDALSKPPEVLKYRTQVLNLLEGEKGEEPVVEAPVPTQRELIISIILKLLKLLTK